jgi:MSHA biogenesis protein MshJ
MNKQIELTKEWILKRSKRQQIGLFLLSLVLIYYFFHSVLIQSVINRQNILRQQIIDVKSQESALQQQLGMIKKIINSPEFKSVLNQQKQLQVQGKNVKKTIANFTPIFVAESDFSKLTKDILSQIDKNIILVSLKEFPDQSWNAPEVNKSVIAVKNINEHKLTIEFRANYFATIAYLNRLEKLPWHLYWDSLEYKVIKYPEANVIIQIYVLSNKVGV